VAEGSAKDGGGGGSVKPESSPRRHGDTEKIKENFAADLARIERKTGMSAQKSSGPFVSITSCVTERENENT
jgi:hypothetical protein